MEGIYPSITLSENYIKTLKVGEHTIKFILDDGREIETTFTIAENENTDNNTNNTTNNANCNNPQTGDKILLFLGLVLISVIGIITTTKLKIKHKNK